MTRATTRNSARGWERRLARTVNFQPQRGMGTPVLMADYVEPIWAPNVVSAVYLNGVVQSPSSYSIERYRALHLRTPPLRAWVVTADFSFWFRCRFVDDSYDFEQFMNRLWSLKKLTFISVRT